MIGRPLLVVASGTEGGCCALISAAIDTQPVPCCSCRNLYTSQTPNQ